MFGGGSYCLKVPISGEQTEDGMTGTKIIIRRRRKIITRT